MARELLDYSWARPGGAAIKNSGRIGVARYLFEDGQGGKGLDASELADLLNNGLEIVLIYEAYAASMREGFNTGKAHAQAAQREINRLGLPANSVVYFAADWDASASEQAAIDDYLNGAASVIGRDRVGIYGSFDVMDRTMASGTAKFFWQTYAWSRGKVREGIHLYQYLNGQDINGAVDFNRTSLDNFGQVSKAGQVTAPSQPSAPQAPAAAGGTYTVQPNDNLSTIAKRFNTTVDSLVALNNIANKNLIYPGQVLKLSGQAAAAATTSASTQNYTVVRNDTLSGIAQRYNTNYQTLQAMNGIADPNKIYEGDVIKVPASGAAAAPASQKTYTVQPNDILSKIAEKFGTDWPTLQRINGIPDANKIYPGQVIKLP